MLTGTSGHASALVAAVVVLTGVVILPHGAAAADPNPDDQFLALLNQKGIPALENVPSLIATAHRVCRQLDGGMPADGVVDDMRERAFKVNSAGGQYPPDRVMRTIARFISASVEAYCPSNQPKIASLQSMANPVPGSNEPTQRGTTNTHNAANSIWSESDARTASIGLFPEGETGQPEPPQLPPPPPPTARIMTPPLPAATPPPPRQPPPPQQEPPSGPQQEPPAAPGPGSPPDIGGPGGGPESPAMPPGRVRLAP